MNEVNQEGDAFLGRSRAQVKALRWELKCIISYYTLSSNLKWKKEKKNGNTKAQDCPAIQNELMKMKLSSLSQRHLGWKGSGLIYNSNQIPVPWAHPKGCIWDKMSRKCSLDPTQWNNICIYTCVFVLNHWQPLDLFIHATAFICTCCARHTR